MNWVSKILGAGNKGGSQPTAYRAPSDEYAQSIDAIRAALQFHLESKDEDAWVTITATGSGGEFVVEIAETTINTCKENVDLPSIARNIGLSDLALSIENENGSPPPDPTIHSVPNASPDELAELVNAIFVHHYGLSSSFSVACEIQR